MTVPNLTIRQTLFLVIALLNMLIAVQTGFNVYKAWVNHRNANILRESVNVINLFYDAQKFLSLERGVSVSVLYARPSPTDSLEKELNEYRENGDAALKQGLQLVKEHRNENLDSALRKIEEGYIKLRDVRYKFDEAISAQDVANENALSDELFSALTALIDDTDILIEVFSSPFIRQSPALARPIRFTHVIWGITEYAGREYALLGRIIAENKYPTQKEIESLSHWRGRIQYGWELARSVIHNSDWGDDLRPIMSEAETHYFMNFDQVKDAFVVSGSSTPPSYPISAGMWLELASQAVDSLHIMNDTVLKVSKAYVDNIKSDAEQAIIISILLFVSTVALSFYSWRLIAQRVIQPVNSIADSLYKATQGEYYELPKASNSDDEIGKLVSVLKIFQENSRELERERDRAQAASIAKSEFLANMSHEIRTPMNVVIGLSNILARSSPLTEKQKEFIHTLQLSAESLLSVINDLLDFSKIETQTFELEKIPFSLAGMIEEIVEIFSPKAKEQGLTFNIDLSDVENKEFISDPTRIRQILLNLCGNAIKFTEHGTITFKVQANASNARPGYEDVYISVSDTGIGIAPEKLDYIFEKFTQADSSITRKYGGTGLGLAIAKTFVEMMNGKITVESKLDEGTTFTVYLPLPYTTRSSVPKAVEYQAEEISSKPSPDMYVLLVEDYQPNILVASMYLEQLGFDYDVAKDGYEAVEKAKAKQYHAILMDIQMQGMDGYKATELIRRHEKETGRIPTQIIGVTAHALPSDREKCLKAGMDGYLAKPYKPEELREKLLVSR